MNTNKQYMCPHCSKTFLTQVGMRKCINKHTNRWNADSVKKPPKQNLHPSRSPVESKKCATSFGVGCTEYQPEVIFLDPFGKKNKT